MLATHTPLRYPGGKAKLGPFLTSTFVANNLIGGTYAEPYAGGAGAGMHLLLSGYASRFLLNDIDHGVVAFWRAVLNHTEKFARRVETVPLAVREWDRQKQVYSDSRRSGFDFGFAFFYLNRTNRSGIMNAGIIGGREQKGDWGIGARFNRAELAGRIRALGACRRAISVSRLDAMDFLDELPRRKSMLVYLDPPYFGKGKDLYTNHYSESDHALIARKLPRLGLPWLMTYDNCSEIRRLYRRYRVYGSEVTYSARNASRGHEVVVFGPGLKLPEALPVPGRSGRQLGFKLREQLA